jgi:hypothetical protein
VRAGVTRWTALGVFWSTLAVAGWVIDATGPTGGASEAVFSLLLMVVAWVGAIVTSFAIRSRYDRRVGRWQPRARTRRLTREDLGLRAAPGARSVGLVVLALLAYGAITGVGPMASCSCVRWRSHSG